MPRLRALQDKEIEVMAINYGWEKFHLAVLSLASGSGSIQSRLANVFVSSLKRVEPSKDLPPELQAEFASILQEMTSVQPKGKEGSLAASAQAMSTERASEIAERIVSMYDTIVRQDELQKHKS